MRIIESINNILNKKYQLWVINTSDEAQLYIWDNWKLIFPLIDTLVNLSSEKAYIRTNQALEHKNDWLGFGRMVWNKSNNEKWTKKYRENEYANEKVTFYDTQIWAPDWNQCFKSNITSDIFIYLYHYPNENVKITKEGLVIAMPVKIYNMNIGLIESVLNKLLNIIPNSTLAYTTRSWRPSNGYPNHIEDINNWELERVLKNV